MNVDKINCIVLISKHNNISIKIIRDTEYKLMQDNNQ